jgi:hypothetical protein
MSEEESKQLRDLLIREPEIAEWLGDGTRDADESQGDERSGDEI